MLEKLMKDPKAANEALGGGKAEADFSVVSAVHLLAEREKGVP